MNIYQQIIEKKTKVSIIGLGYVGLPLALEFAKKISVVGFEIREDKIDLLEHKIDPANELDQSAFEDVDIIFTSDANRLKDASFHIVAVPTPIDKYNHPNLTPLLSATKTVAGILKKGDYVVFESTVYPGATEEKCIPILENISGLKFEKDFKVGYSPERINPGDKVHTLTNTMKIVSGCDSLSLDNIANVYEIVIQAGVHRAPNIKVAEAAKIIENTQRDVNIALMNELSIIFDRIGINTYDVLEAAGTKWNFLKFYPGLVGGHCIGVDPYYLVHKALQLKYHPRVINAGRCVNDSMGEYIANKLVKTLIAQGKNIQGAKVLIMGITFKENVSDIRNSKVVDIIRELKDYGVKIDIVDPYAKTEEVKKKYNIEMKSNVSSDYDAVIMAVSHKDYVNLSEKYFMSITSDNAVFVDVKGIYKGMINKINYWSL